MATTKVSTKLLETVGVAEGGTGATSTSAARTSLGLVIGTNVLAPGGDGSSLTGIAGGATDSEKANIMLNAFRISVNGGLTVQNMVDGVADVFEDETGVDTSTSTNETYDATNDLYKNVGGYTTDRIPTMTSATAPSGTVTVSNEYNAASAAWRAVNDVTTTDDHWYSYSHAPTTSSPDWIAYDWGSGQGKVIIKYTIQTSDYAPRSPKDYKLYGWNGSSYVLLDTQTNQTSWSVNEIRAHTFSNTTSYEKYKLEITAVDGGTYVYLKEWELIESLTPPNMTLVSNATTALATPTDNFIVLWQEDVDSVTLNTDLKAYVSRDGGTTWTQITLAKEATLTTGQILTGSADISGQPSGTSMKYKVETLNTKEQKIHAVALQWS